MEIKVLIYIIIGVVYAVGWFIKKMNKKAEEAIDDRTQNPQSQKGYTTPSNKPKQLTFEELLKEITESKTVQEQTQPTLQPAYVDYDDDIEEEAQSLEQIPVNYQKKDNIYDVYEEAKKAAFNRPSLEETMNVQDTDVKFGRFKVFEDKEQNNLLGQYTKAFHDPAGLKKAFVMGEILKPKF